MTGLILLVLALLVGIGFFLYKNLQDERDLQKLVRDTQAEDEAHDRTHIL
jgi:hypothetical protein